MKIILEEDVKGKGKRGQLINVADGYGTFLIRSKKASLATESVVNKWNRIHDNEKLQDSLQRTQALDNKKLLESNSLVFKVKAKNGKVFGTVTSSDVAKRINEEYSLDVGKKDVSISQTSFIGTYAAKVSLYKDVVAEVRVIVSEG